MNVYSILHLNITGAGLLKRGVSPPERFTNILREIEGNPLVISMVRILRSDLKGQNNNLTGALRIPSMKHEDHCVSPDFVSRRNYMNVVKATNLLICIIFLHF